MAFMFVTLAVLNRGTEVRARQEVNMKLMFVTDVIVSAMTTFCSEYKPLNKAEKDVMLPRWFSRTRSRMPCRTIIEELPSVRLVQLGAAMAMSNQPVE